MGRCSDLVNGLLVTGDFIGTAEVGLCSGLAMCADCMGLSSDMRVLA